MKFEKADTGHSHLKCGIMGLAGSGKTFTSSQIAIGLVGYIREKGAQVKNRVAFVDTENGAAWVMPRFKEASIELMVARTRSLPDLRDGIKWAEENADVLIIDSITHFWTIFCEEYATRLNRRRGLEFSDWNAVKKEWRVNFTDLYLNSRLHIIMCGRQGYDYDMQTNQAGKKELVKTGVKMKAEGETGFEPSLLCQMEQTQVLSTDGSLKAVHRECYVLKDRSTKLDGKVLQDPAFKDFLPHIKTLDIGGAGVAIDTTRNNSELIKDDRGTMGAYLAEQKEIVLEEIAEEIKAIHPGSTEAARAARTALGEKIFGTKSWKAVEAMRLDDLKEGRNKIWIESRGHAYGVVPGAATSDQSPIADEMPEAFHQ